MKESSFDCHTFVGFSHCLECAKYAYDTDVQNLLGVIRRGLQKMRTYHGIYKDDKELTRLLDEWETIAEQIKEPA